MKRTTKTAMLAIAVTVTGSAFAHTPLSKTDSSAVTMDSSYAQTGDSAAVYTDSAFAHIRAAPMKTDSSVIAMDSSLAQTGDTAAARADSAITYIQVGSVKADSSAMDSSVARSGDTTAVSADSAVTYIQVRSVKADSSAVTADSSVAQTGDKKQQEAVSNNFTAARLVRNNMYSATNRELLNNKETARMEEKEAM